jgi:hypothetical protein
MGEQDGALKQVGELFGKVGWDKRLQDLSMDEVVGIVLVIQKVEGIDDVYTEEHLADLFNKYGRKPEQFDCDIPF